MRDWDTIDYLTQGFRQPEPPPPSISQPEPPYVVQQPTSTRADRTMEASALFGTHDVYTKEMDALAREITTVHGVRAMKDEVFSLYEEIDESIVVDANPITRGRKMRWSLKAEKGLEARTERYLGRGSGTTTETFTVQATRQDRRY
jgi:hypothetical protein